MDVAFLVYMHKLTVQRHVRSKHLLVYKPQHQAVLSKGDRIVVNPEGVAEVLDLAS